MSDPNGPVPRDRIIESGWRLWTVTIGFYGIGVICAVALALQAHARGVPTFVAILYGAFVGTVAAYYVFHYAFRLSGWFRCRFLKGKTSRDRVLKS
jgi:hypothetical protein